MSMGVFFSRYISLVVYIARVHLLLLLLLPDHSLPSVGVVAFVASERPGNPPPPPPPLLPLGSETTIRTYLYSTVLRGRDTAEEEMVADGPRTY